MSTGYIPKRKGAKRNQSPSHMKGGAREHQKTNAWEFHDWRIEHKRHGEEKEGKNPDCPLCK